MVKFFILAAIACLAIVSSRVDGGPHHGGYGHTTPPPPCSNITAIQSFVAAYQALITQLTNNGSFTDWLQVHAQEIAYIQNADNTAIIASNCTGYLSGLSAASAVDKAALDQRLSYLKTAGGLTRSLYRQFNVISGNGDHDSHERF